MPKDTDGTNWAVVRFTCEVAVMADTEWEAELHARLALAADGIDPDGFQVEAVAL
jgi:hypothetical protein